MDATRAVVQIDDLSFRYRDDSDAALQNLSFTVDQGEVVAVIGANGAGKSTLLKCLVGLLSNAEGQAVSVDGAIGFLPQEDWLDPYATTKQSLTLQAKLSKTRVDWNDADFQAWLERLGLPALLDKRTAMMSGGQQRRVALGCALINRPSLLLMDEPTNGLDVNAQTELWSYLAPSAYATPLTVLFISHDMFEVENRATRVLALHQGKLLEDTTPAELVSRAGVTTVTLETKRTDHRWDASEEAFTRIVPGSTFQKTNPQAHRLFLAQEPTDSEISALLEVCRDQGLAFSIRPSHLEDYFFRF
ncbi:MAG: ABC transporter ATP-binding protein, partial [Acidobacteriota bacterium]